MEKTALVLRNVHFEDLGSLANPLEDAGYKIKYSDIADVNFCKGDPLQPDLLIILGGPIGVYEDFAYRGGYRGYRGYHNGNDDWAWALGGLATRDYDNTFQPFHGPRRACVSPYY